MSILTQRVLVAAIGIPVVVWIALYRPLGLLGLTLIAALLAVHEFYGLAKAKGFVPQVAIGMALTVLIVLGFARIPLVRMAAALHLNITFSTLTIDFLPLVMIAGVIATLTAELFKGYPNPFVQVAVTLAGAAYIGFCMGGFYGVHQFFYDPKNESLLAGYFIITMLASIWICDTAAYFVGRTIGKNKIAERVSPNKTWEGGIAGLVAAILTWIVAPMIVSDLSILSKATLIAMGLIVGVFGQIGDFAESMLKRDAGVKDSSTLIPGHGGVLDRLDSILFVAPLSYLYLHLFGA
jgi:phosphatidate cytidylyltransferase